MAPDSGLICERETPPTLHNTADHRIYCHIPLEQLRELEPVVTAD